MKLVHLSDLHLGKRMNEFSLLDDQKYILRQISDVIEREKPNAVAIAGDVYDKDVPSPEAVALFDEFLYGLAKMKTQVFVIGGNHDSQGRLSFASRLIDGSGVHISRAYTGETTPYELTDEYGKIYVYALPFVNPTKVRKSFPEEKIENYTDALAVAVKKMNVDYSARNILIAHQFVTGAKRSESETISVGGSDNADGRVFEKFDYTALGHIHSPQNAYGERVRYCGTPLKYSFSEMSDKKSVTIAELKEKGNFTLRTIPLQPMRGMAEIRGAYEDLMRRDYYEGTTYREDFIRAVLTDEQDILNAAANLRTVYKNLLELKYDNARTRKESVFEPAEESENKSPYEIFCEFYEAQNGKALSEKQQEAVQSAIEEIWGEKA